MLTCHIAKAGLRPAHGTYGNRVTCTKDEGSGYSEMVSAVQQKCEHEGAQ